MSVTLPAPLGYDASNLVFNDSFSGTTLNASTWNTYLTSNPLQGAPSNGTANGGSGEFGGADVTDASYYEPSQVVQNNGLNINTIQQSVVGATTWGGIQYSHTYPYTSGTICSYSKFEFDGGYMQISMKQPAGTENGVWPALWLLPGQGAGNVGNNFEIDIQEGGASNGSTNPNQILAETLHMGSVSKGWEYNAGIDLSASFNTYGINWIPGQSITWYFNGKQMYQVTSAQMTIPNEPMQLIIGTGVDPSNGSTWHSLSNSSTPASTTTQIADVQLYQLPGNGETVLGANVPTLTIASAGRLTNQTTQVIAGTIDTADAGLTVSIYDGTVLLGTTTADATGAWSKSVALPTTQGAQSLTATATNAAGNTGTSATVVYTLDTIAPTLAITSAGGLTNQTAKTISGTIDAADANQTVSIYDGASLLGTTTPNSAGVWSKAVTLLPAQGAQSITATAADAAGNVGASSAVIATLDTLAPTLAITSSGGLSDLTTQTIRGTIDAADAGLSVSIYDGAILLGTTTANSAGVWSQTVALPSTLGAQSITANAIDTAGNVGTSSAIVFNLQNEQPVANVHANNIAYSGDVTGPYNFIDAQNLEASYGDLIQAFGTNTQAMQNWYNYYQTSAPRPTTFDGLDYIASYGDLINGYKSVGSEQAMLDAGAAHFISNGLTEGRTTTFNGLDYIASYGDLIAAFGANGDAGAFHYIEHGVTEGRTTTFDGLDYIASYSDLITAYGANEQAGAAHFIGNGHAEGRTTTFNGLDYIAGNTDLMTAYGANNDAGASHYISAGYYEGRSAAPLNVAAYETAHPDLIGKFSTNDAFLTAYINTYATTGKFLT